MFGKTIQIPSEILNSWTNSLSVLCRAVNVSATFIVQHTNSTVQILCSNRKDSDYLSAGMSYAMTKPAVQCAMLEQQFIYIQNIKDSKCWESIYPPEICIISYLSVSLQLPDNTYFATLALVTETEKEFSDIERDTVMQFKEIVELHIKCLWNEQLLKVKLSTQYPFASGVLLLDETIDNKIKLLSEIVNIAHSAVLVTNIDGKVEYCNRKFEEVSGFTFNELEGKPLTAIKSGKQSKAFYDEMWATILSGHIWKGEICNRRKNGELFWEHSTIYPSRNEKNEITHFINIKEEITHLKELHQELFETKAKAADAEAVQNSFISNISHEIRTPMNAIVGFSDLLRISNISETQRQEFVELIIKNTQQLQSIIDDVLDLSEIEAGRIKIEKKKINLNALMREILQTYEQQNQKLYKKEVIFKLRCEINEPLFNISTDEHRLRQILQNLMGNALKFTNKGAIELGYTIESKHGLFIRFFVKDTGIGIAKEKINIIFSRFGQVESPFKRSIRGMGLGLPITKNLVELLGGEIWVETEVGRGANFNFTIPYKFQFSETETDKTDEPNFITRTENEYNWKGKNILLVEDEDSNFTFYNEVLRKTHANLIWQTDGTHAIQFCTQNIENQNIDIILMDIKMPELNGIEATKEILKLYKKAMSAGKVKNIPPIIAQTAYTNHNEREDSLKAGCLDFITKPLKSSELLLVISKYI